MPLSVLSTSSYSGNSFAEVLEKFILGLRQRSQETECIDHGHGHIVVTGGRDLKFAETFKMIEKFAEKLDVVGILKQ